ncbi:MarR family winged helix-turn-helix transcriptional regulator [Methanocella paludicola]|nr:MarR family transcriptional regulator [Methanocella paludicola]
MGKTGESGAVNALHDEHIYMTVKSLLTILNKMRSDRLETWSDKLKGISKMELHILLLVQAQPDIVLGEIKDRLDVPNSTLTGVIDRMEKQGLARRTISPRDRRSYGLELTEKGKEVRKEHDRILLMLASNMLDPLDDRERTTFIRLLSKIADNMHPGGE